MLTLVGNENGTGVAAPLRRLDVGAGAKYEDGWDRMDISPVFAPEYQHDLTQMPWPFDDGTFDELRCWHVLEHIENKHRIPVMNEMHRVLKSGGKVEIEVPMFPYWQSIADPTHVSFFVAQSFDYFCAGKGFDDHMQLYGIKPWEFVSRVGGEDGKIKQFVLRKPE